MIQRRTDLPSECAQPPNGRLSYKFQRLREQLRAAIEHGEFQGKLPGERTLGRRYGVNAKTVNKALCDLAGEGILVRIIGCGTFVARDRDTMRAPGDRRMFHVLTGRQLAGGDYATAIQLAALSDARGVNLESIAVYRARERVGEIPLIAWPKTDRRYARGVIVLPGRPLDDAHGHPSPELIAETWRRHTPLVVLGACPKSAKVNNVVPDYQDAGFQLASHLFRNGCDRVAILLSNDDGRECRRAIGGCQSAALRLNKPLSAVDLHRADDPPTMNGNGTGLGFPLADDQTTGVLCMGSRAFDILKGARDRPNSAETLRRVMFASLLEPGDDRARHANVTSYETDVDAMATWAVRLIQEAQPGQSPSEVLIPGDLCVRDPACDGALIRNSGAADGQRRMEPAAVC